MGAALNGDLKQARPKNRIFKEEKKKTSDSEDEDDQSNGVSIESREEEDEENESDIQAYGDSEGKDIYDDESGSPIGSHEGAALDQDSSDPDRQFENSESPGKDDNGESQIEKFAEKIGVEKKLEEHAKAINGIEDKENINIKSTN